jgi:formylglycine-generating enzyme required for sulfatase activity
MIRSLTKTSVVVVSSIILTTLAANAIEMNGQFYRSMLGAVFASLVDSTEEKCPEGMVLVDRALLPFCIDRYEISTNDTCPFSDPVNEDETAINMANPNCKGITESHKLPWRNITQLQAQDACQRVGKRLPSASEWYKAALGTPDMQQGWDEDSCNVASNRADGVAPSGSGMRCVSEVGAYDMVGNVWEWVSDTVENGTWKDRELPLTGFVSAVDMDGVAYDTSTGVNENYNNDRIWVDATLSTGMMRGGYHGSQTQGGVFALYAASPPSFSGEAVGFRCVADVEIDNQ